MVTTRNDVHYVVTEFGIANLYGKTFRQRAKALIDVAHPDFREALDEPHVAERGLLVEADGRHHIASPIRFAGEAEFVPGKVPEL